MSKAFDHLKQLRFCPLLGHFCYQADNSRHRKRNPFTANFLIQLICLIAKRCGKKDWSRREELNAPSAEYNSAALSLSYTGLERALRLYHFERMPTPRAIKRSGRIPTKPR